MEMLLGDLVLAQTTVEAALAEARAVGAELTEARALNTLGFTRAGLGQEEEGIATMREAHARAGAIASPSDRSRAAVNLSEVLDLAGHTEEALAVVDAELIQVAQAPGAHQLRRLPGDPGRQPAGAARPARRGARAAAPPRPGRGGLLHGHLLARHACAARAARRRPRRPARGAHPAARPQRERRRAAVDRAAYRHGGRAGRPRGPARGGPDPAAPRVRPDRALRRGDAAHAHDLDGAARRGRGGGARPGARRALRAGARRGRRSACASAPRPARASTRRAPGAGWRPPSCSGAARCWATRPPTRARGRRSRSRSTPSRCRSRPRTRATAPPRRT